MCMYVYIYTYIQDTKAVCVWLRMLAIFFCRNMVRNGLWPTSVYNLGVGVAVLSSSLASDAKVLQPVNTCIWSVAEKLHIHQGILNITQIII